MPKLNKVTWEIWVPSEAIEVMEWSAVEVYPKETLGVLVGDYAGHGRYEIESAVPLQLAGRTLCGTSIDGPGKSALEDFYDERFLGFFHSHPYTREGDPAKPALSCFDAKTMKKDGHDVWAVVWITAGRRKKWIRKVSFHCMDPIMNRIRRPCVYTV